MEKSHLTRVGKRDGTEKRNLVIGASITYFSLSALDLELLTNA